MSATTRSVLLSRRRASRGWIAAVVFALLALGVTGCARVRPWDRDLLAKKKMSFVPSPRENATDDHIYFSKEGSTGGQRAGGGGCGCN